MSPHAIHHVTCVTANIAENMRFYTEVLGLRLVKRSVNQDDVRAYHLFYADEVGSPGTDITFFDWPGMAANVPGAASVALTSFTVPVDSLRWWELRLQQAGLFVEPREGSLLFADPEGQRLELVAAARSDSKPWTQAVGPEHAITGILGVDLESAHPESTHRVLTDILGYAAGKDGLYETEGARLRIVAGSTGFGRLGAGGVHHVAFRVKDEDELLEMERKVNEAGLRTSGEIDRFWFRSVYFREPGGILFELATDGPGFGTDEDMAHLGEKLVLPPFLEGRRAEIEAGLTPLPS